MKSDLKDNFREITAGVEDCTGIFRNSKLEGSQTCGPVLGALANRIELSKQTDQVTINKVEPAFPAWGKEADIYFVPRLPCLLNMRIAERMFFSLHCWRNFQNLALPRACRCFLTLKFAFPKFRPIPSIYEICMSCHTGQCLECLEHVASFTVDSRTLEHSQTRVGSFAEAVDVGIAAACAGA